MYRRAVFALVCVCLIQGPTLTTTNSDNLALLAGTLKTMQRAACDDEIVSLACPRGTSITIQVAQYGKMAPAGHSCIADRSQSQPVAVEVLGTEKCLWPNSMQYSLLQTVVEACQKKPMCKFSTQPKPGLVDPCPFARKFVEVAYKCRPNEFRIRAVCEDDVIRLTCNPHSRVAVYEAQYGRVAYEPLTCPQPQGVLNTTCMTAHSTETVMQLCHGKRRCEVQATRKNFGSPCKPETRTYLKIVYACVPLGVLTERFESAAEKDEILNNVKNDLDSGGLFDERDGGERWGGEPSVVPPEPALSNPALQYPDNYEDDKTVDKQDTSGLRTRHHSNVTEPNTGIFVYVGIGVFIFIILVLLLIGVRCYIIRRTSQASKNGDMFTTDVPNVFNDAVSDVDNDIDIAHISGTFYEHPDMILYRDVPGKGTIRAMRPLSTIYPCAGSSMYGVDYVPTHSREVSLDGCRKTEEGREVTSPKTLARYSDSQFYYG